MLKNNKQLIIIAMILISSIIYLMSGNTHLHSTKQKYVKSEMVKLESIAVVSQDETKQDETLSAQDETLVKQIVSELVEQNITEEQLSPSGEEPEMISADTIADITFEQQMAEENGTLSEQQIAMIADIEENPTPDWLKKLDLQSSDEAKPSKMTNRYHKISRGYVYRGKAGRKYIYDVNNHSEFFVERKYNPYYTIYRRSISNLNLKASQHRNTGFTDYFDQFDGHGGKWYKVIKNGSALTVTNKSRKLIKIKDVKPIYPVPTRYDDIKKIIQDTASNLHSNFDYSLKKNYWGHGYVIDAGVPMTRTKVEDGHKYLLGSCTHYHATLQATLIKLMPYYAGRFSNISVYESSLKNLRHRSSYPYISYEPFTDKLILEGNPLRTNHRVVGYSDGSHFLYLSYENIIDTPLEEYDHKRENKVIKTYIVDYGSNGKGACLVKYTNISGKRLKWLLDLGKKPSRARAVHYNTRGYKHVDGYYWQRVGSMNTRSSRNTYYKVSEDKKVRKIYRNQRYYIWDGKRYITKWYNTWYKYYRGRWYRF